MNNNNGFFYCKFCKIRLCVALVSEILDKMGEASAVAQKLQTPVTSSIKFSHSDQIIYLMIDLHENT